MIRESGATTEDYSRISWLAKTTVTPSNWKWPISTVYLNGTEFPIRLTHDYQPENFESLLTTALDVTFPALEDKFIQVFTTSTPKYHHHVFPDEVQENTDILYDASSGDGLLVIIMWVALSIALLVSLGHHVAILHKRRQRFKLALRKKNGLSCSKRVSYWNKNSMNLVSIISSLILLNTFLLRFTSSVFILPRFSCSLWVLGLSLTTFVSSSEFLFVIVQKFFILKSEERQKFKRNNECIKIIKIGLITTWTTSILAFSGFMILDLKLIYPPTCTMAYQEVIARLTGPVFILIFGIESLFLVGLSIVAFVKLQRSIVSQDVISAKVDEPPKERILNFCSIGCVPNDTNNIAQNFHTGVGGIRCQVCGVFVSSIEQQCRHQGDFESIKDEVNNKLGETSFKEQCWNFVNQIFHRKYSKPYTMKSIGKEEISQFEVDSHQPSRIPEEDSVRHTAKDEVVALEDGDELRPGQTQITSFIENQTIDEKRQTFRGKLFDILFSDTKMPVLKGLHRNNENKDLEETSASYCIHFEKINQDSSKERDDIPTIDAISAETPIRTKKDWQLKNAWSAACDSILFANKVGSTNASSSLTISTQKSWVSLEPFEELNRIQRVSTVSANSNIYQKSLEEDNRSSTPSIVNENSYAYRYNIQRRQLFQQRRAKHEIAIILLKFFLLYLSPFSLYVALLSIQPEVSEPEKHLATWSNLILILCSSLLGPCLNQGLSEFDNQALCMSFVCPGFMQTDEIVVIE